MAKFKNYQFANPFSQATIQRHNGRDLMTFCIFQMLTVYAPSAMVFLR